MTSCSPDCRAPGQPDLSIAHKPAGPTGHCACRVCHTARDRARWQILADEMPVAEVAVEIGLGSGDVMGCNLPGVIDHLHE